MRLIKVSIPFIAGQWSLPRARRRAACDGAVFQSPSLRGSGRFRSNGRGRTPSVAFQSPSLRGSGRFGETPPPSAEWRMVSIPFIAGQWSLRGAPEASSQRFGEVSIPFIAGQWSLPPAQTRRLISPRRFQSPSLRGSGRFGARRRRGAPGPPRFQSPSLRGSGRFTPPGASTSPRSSSFNPLHCGAVVASEAPPGPRNRGGPFQSPSLRGSGRFRRRTAEPGGRAGFQSPSLRGSGRFKWKPCFLQWRRSCFNPLHCGAVVASFF